MTERLQRQFTVPGAADMGDDVTFTIDGPIESGMVQIGDGSEEVIIKLDAVKQFVAWMAREGIAA